ncbi:MAG: hypothetical protein Q7J29_07795 [Stagnimonas sp.]|nr:hypothetical protein [Stagnimonas sp.]
MSNNAVKAALLAVAALSATACATKGSYMGAEKEKAYDAELAVARLTEVVNNDDFMELRKDNTIFVFTDAKSYKIWLKTDEIPLLVTKFRVGPNGEKAKYQLSKNETKAMETTVGFKGASQKMYEGVLDGTTKGFFGFVYTEVGTTYFVFDNWNALKAFKTNGGKPTGFSAAGPNGSTVVYVGASSEPAEAAKKFAALHDGK